jgi:putative membrane protein
METTPQHKLRGLLIAGTSSVAFGFIPLFTLPLMAIGLRTPSILTYRFLFAALAMFPLLLYKKIDLRLTVREIGVLLSLGLVYIASAMGLQLGYHYMPSGVATVVHFTYPVYVILLMLLFYRQRPTRVMILAILLAFFGVLCLSGLGLEKVDRRFLIGMLIVAPTGLAYASYMVIVNKSVVRTMNNIKLSFYALLACGSGFLVIALFWGGLQGIPSLEAWGLTIALAIIPTVVANITLVEGVKLIGSTMSAILGALEPLTAVVIGFLVFDEVLTPLRIVGVLLIILSVLLIALSGRIAYFFKVWHLRKRHR